MSFYQVLVQLSFGREERGTARHLAVRVLMQTQVWKSCSSVPTQGTYLRWVHLLLAYLRDWREVLHFRALPSTLLLLIMAQPRLYHKTLRDLTTSDSLSSSQPRGSFSFAFTAKTKPSSRQVERGSKAKVLHKVRPMKALHTSSFTLIHSSRSSTPRSYLTIEAINLELQITEALTLIEMRPSPQRHREAFSVYMKALASVASKDSAFGPLLLQIKSAVDVYVTSAQYSQTVDLQDRNHALQLLLHNQKALLREQVAATVSLDRQCEVLKREQTLLNRKVEQLEGQLMGDREVLRLQEMLRGARKRERRLLRLLEVVRGEEDTEVREKASKVISSSLSEHSTKSTHSPDFSESHS